MSKAKLILCDRSSSELEIYKQAFEVLEYEVYTCEKIAAQLTEMILMYRPDLVISDAVLASGDICSVMEDVKEQMGEDAPAFLCLLPCENEAISKLLFAAGCGFVLTKPLDLNALTRRAAMLVNTRKQSVPVKTPEFTEADLEVYVTEMLHQVGVPAHIQGYHYVREAIVMAVKDPSVLRAVTKVLYPAVADKYHTKASRVERAIRHSIEVAWDRGDVEVLTSYFGYTVNSLRGKPTNSEFVSLMADRVNLDIKKGIFTLDGIAV